MVSTRIYVTVHHRDPGYELADIDAWNGPTNGGSPPDVLLLVDPDGEVRVWDHLAGHSRQVWAGMGLSDRQLAAARAAADAVRGGRYGARFVRRPADGWAAPA